MSLKLLIDRKSNPYRAEFPNGYHRIYEVNVNKNDNNVKINIFSYPDEEARRFVSEVNTNDPHHMPERHNGNVSPIQSDSFSFLLTDFNKIEGTDEFAKAYKLLKIKNAKYSKAEDC